MTFFESHLSCQGKKYYTFLNKSKTLFLPRVITMVMTKSEKKEKVEDLAKLLNSNSTVAIVDLAKIPAAVQLKIKTDLNDILTMRMSRKTILKMALKNSNKYNESFANKFTGSCALIFSNENPFKLFKMLKSSTVKSSAKEGQTAPCDIIIPKGPTPIAPGPAISTFQKAGLKTKVEAGKIAVITEKAVVKQGEIISNDVVAVLNLLGIKPIEISLGIGFALEDGIIYGTDALDIDIDAIVSNLTKSTQQAINLCIEIDYPTKLAINFMIQKAFIKARNLAVEADITEKEFIGEVLAKAVRSAKALETATGQVE
ncbi:MAG: 50S ribosomal protein L10 [Candidatus Aenigmarchaeota archaeon]|nr:50S ribosomal protein L10 [Candidatus Aenigmarchaeota archaeon]